MISSPMAAQPQRRRFQTSTSKTTTKLEEGIRILLIQKNKVNPIRFANKTLIQIQVKVYFSIPTPTLEMM